jgi:peptide/nickel transport system substrate-binding protein
VPDASTQVAEFVTGNLDLMRADSPDQARDLAQKPGVVKTVRNVASIIYVLMDMKGRSGNKALTEPKVRDAIMKAIDKRPFPILVGSDGSNVGFPEALCNRVHFGCDYSRPLPQYDLAEAKRLMAEAGYAQGFNMTITAVESPMIEIAQVIASQLKAININASVGRDTFSSYRDKQRDGKIEFLVQTYGGSGLSDVSQILDFYFSKGPRDFHGRADWSAAVNAANGEMDETKRKAIVRDLMDQVTDSRYMIPISPYPKIWIHTSDVQVKETGRFFFGYGITMSEISWKK